MSSWAPSAVALVVEGRVMSKRFVSLVTFNSWKEASVFDANLWRILNDCADPRMLWPPYK